MLSSIFFDKIFGRSVSSGGIFTAQDLMGLCLPGSDLWLFLDQPQDTAPHVSMYNYSTYSLSIYYTIDFRLRHRFCLDFVVFSRQKQKFEPKPQSQPLSP